MIKNKTSLRGFTLLELIVVIAIIGVLSVIILPSFTTALARSRDGRKISELRGIQASLIQWAQNNNGLYPGDYMLATPTSAATCSTSTSYATSSFCALISAGIETRLPSGVWYNSLSTGSSTYNYDGVACSSTTFLCQSYQLWTNLEQTNTALSADADASSTSASVWGSSIFLTAGTFASTGTVPRADIETCNGGFNCIFDLVP